MATVSTSSSDNGQVSTWSIPPGSTPPGQVSRGEVVFQGSDQIPAVGAGDDSLFMLQCNFPRNFIYRVVEWRAWVVGNSEGALEGPEQALTLIVSSDAPDFNDFYALAPMTSWFDGAAGAPVSNLNYVPSAATNDRMSFFKLSQPIDTFIDSNAGAARLFHRWVNPTASTSAFTIYWRIRALMYDVEQLRKYSVHTPTPVISP